MRFRGEYHVASRDGVPYYKVRVESAQSRYNLVPGMQAAHTIRTGQRSVMADVLEHA